MGTQVREAASAPPAPASVRRHRPRGRPTDLLFVLPALLLVVAFIIIPAGVGVWHSFTDWQPGYDSPFVGLANYTRLLTSPIFHQIIFNQAVFLLVVPIAIIVALWLAFLLQEGAPVPAVFRSIFFLPAVLPAAAAGVAFVFVLSPDGPLNSVLRTLGLDRFAVNWLTNPTLVKPVLILVLVWSSVGVGVMIFSAAMGTIPREMLEAARLDGAGPGREFRYIVVPALRPTIGLFAIVEVIQVLLWSFPWIYVMTAGGPGYASTTIDWDVYQNTIRFGRFGIGAAEAVIIVLIVALLVGFSSLASRRSRGSRR